MRQELSVQLDDDAILAGNPFDGLDGDVDIDGGPGITIKRCWVPMTKVESQIRTFKFANGKLKELFDGKAESVYTESGSRKT